MQVTVKHGNVQTEPAEALVVNLFEGVTEPRGATGALDKALGGQIRDLIASGDFTGKRNRVAVLYPRGVIPARRVMVVGLGPQETFGLNTVREVAASVAKHARDLAITHLTTIVHGAGTGGISPEAAAQATVEGTLLGLHRFKDYKRENSKPPSSIEAITILEADPTRVGAFQVGAHAGQIAAEAVILARDLAYQPGNYLTPTRLAETVQAIAQESGLRCQVLDRPDMEELGMGALLGVSQGSAQPPKFVILEYDPPGSPISEGAEGAPPVVLVGKGITFDSGGISLKPPLHMFEMKSDMCGAADVIAVMQAAARLGIKRRVVGLIVATENMPGGTALKPGDVIRALNGRTIEIRNTDAEGRLVLADALSYAARYQPAAVIDIATLTGGAVWALGYAATALMGTDTALVERIKAAAEASGEPVWELPLWDAYDYLIESEIADVRNSVDKGSPVPAATIVGGKFLSRFAEGYPWAHLDIAATAWPDREGPYTPKGPTGVGVRLLIELLRQWEREAGEQGRRGAGVPRS